MSYASQKRISWVWIQGRESKWTAGGDERDLRSGGGRCIVLYERERIQTRLKITEDGPYAA